MFQERLLDGKVVVVTGGGTGLGLSMARRFAELGARLVLCGRRMEPLEAAVAGMTARGHEALALGCDVRDYAQVERMVAGAVERFGRIDALVNNAAGNFLCPTEELTPNGFAAVVGIVLNGTFHCTHAVGKQMIAQRSGGVILSITTTYAELGSAYVVPSACAKAGVLCLMRSLAVEWAKYKVRCNAIAPGPFPTEGAWSRLVPPGFEEVMSPNRIPARRFGEHHELADLASFLLSDGSAYITGQQLVIDGGESLMGGEFNGMTLLDPENVAQVLRMMRPAKK